MPFSLGYLLEAALLVVNGLAVLQDYSPSLNPGDPPVPRFLAKMGWTAEDAYGDNTSVKSKFIQLTNAVRTLLRVPLIAINLITILYLMFLG